MGKIKRLVLDVLKPHKPSMIEFAQRVEDAEGVSGVNATLVEIDEEVQNIKLTVEGDSINQEDVEHRVKDLGGSIHSYDEIVCGEKMVEESETPQD